MDKAVDLLRNKCPQIKDNDDYIVGCNQVKRGFLYHITL